MNYKRNCQQSKETRYVSELGFTRIQMIRTISEEDLVQKNN